MSSDEAFLVEVLAALRLEKLEAIVIGAVAAGLHGAPIMTADVDLLVRDTPRSHQKVEALAVRLGARTVTSELSRVVTLVGARAEVDILFGVIAGGLGFESLKGRAERVQIGDETAVVASLADVIASKKSADRPKDRAVMPILESTLRVLLATKKR